MLCSLDSFYKSSHINNNHHITGGGVDYNSGPYNVTFPARATSVSFTITIINDNVLEYNEAFDITIIEGTLPENFILGEVYLAKVTIDSGKRTCTTTNIPILLATTAK